ncbi:MAG: KaiC domain-containing protein, partial [Aquificae bacterium]|nr:KaiC domain-containing protein [Aquificota bacterium]
MSEKQKYEYEKEWVYEHREPRIIKESILTGSKALEKAPKIYGIPTGIEGLDELFFIAEVENGKVVKKPLGGIPAYSVF